MDATIHPDLGYTERHLQGGDITTVLRGDLDVAAAPRLRERLRSTLDAMHPAQALTIDLSAVTFCDAAGLAVLVGTYRHARTRGIPVTLTRPQTHVTKVLNLTGLARLFTTPARPPVEKLPNTRGPRIRGAEGRASTVRPNRP